MKVTLIEPAMIKNNDFSEKPSWQLTPLTLATLAGITPDDVERRTNALWQGIGRVLMPGLQVD